MSRSTANYTRAGKAALSQARQQRPIEEREIYYNQAINEYTKALQIERGDEARKTAEKCGKIALELANLCRSAEGHMNDAGEKYCRAVVYFNQAIQHVPTKKPPDIYEECLNDAYAYVHDPRVDINTAIILLESIREISPEKQVKFQCSFTIMERYLEESDKFVHQEHRDLQSAFDSLEEGKRISRSALEFATPEQSATINNCRSKFSKLTSRIKSLQKIDNGAIVIQELKQNPHISHQHKTNAAYEAVDYFRRAIEIAQEHQHVDLIITAHTHMAEVFQDLLRKPSEAEHHCLEIRKLTLRVPDNMVEHPISEAGKSSPNLVNQTWSKFISQHVKDDPEQVLHSICENYKPQTTSFKCPSTAELRTMKPVDFQIELTKALKSYEKASVSKLKEQPYIVNKLNDMMREVKDREPSTWSRFISQHAQEDPREMLYSICENYKLRTSSYQCPFPPKLRTMLHVEFQTELTKASEAYEKVLASKLKEKNDIVNKLNCMMRELEDRKPPNPTAKEFILNVNSSPRYNTDKTIDKIILNYPLDNTQTTVPIRDYINKCEEMADKGQRSRDRADIARELRWLTVKKVAHNVPFRDFIKQVQPPTLANIMAMICQTYPIPIMTDIDILPTVTSIKKSERLQEAIQTLVHAYETASKSTATAQLTSDQQNNFKEIAKYLQQNKDSTINDFRNFIEDLYRGRLEDRERFRKICQKYHLTQSRHATNTGVHTSIHGNQLITEMKDVARKYEREESCLHKMIASEIRWIIDMVKIPKDEIVGKHIRRARKVYSNNQKALLHEICIKHRIPNAHYLQWIDLAKLDGNGFSRYLEEQIKKYQKESDVCTVHYGIIVQQLEHMRSEYIPQVFDLKIQVACDWKQYKKKVYAFTGKQTDVALFYMIHEMERYIADHANARTYSDPYYLRVWLQRQTKRYVKLCKHDLDELGNSNMSERDILDHMQILFSLPHDTNLISFDSARQSYRTLGGGNISGEICTEIMKFLQKQQDQQDLGRT